MKHRGRERMEYMFFFFEVIEVVESSRKRFFLNDV